MPPSLAAYAHFWYSSADIPVFFAASSMAPAVSAADVAMASSPAPTVAAAPPIAVTTFPADETIELNAFPIFLPPEFAFLLVSSIALLASVLSRNSVPNILNRLCVFATFFSPQPVRRDDRGKLFHDLLGGHF